MSFSGNILGRGRTNTTHTERSLYLDIPSMEEDEQIENIKKATNRTKKKWALGAGILSGTLAVGTGVKVGLSAGFSLGFLTGGIGVIIGVPLGALIGYLVGKFLAHRQENNAMAELHNPAEQEGYEDL